MKKRFKRLISGVAIGAGLIGSAFLLQKTKLKKEKQAGKAERRSVDKWARPNMRVTFRAEVMPGRDSSERSFRVTRLLSNGRVLLDGVSGEHSENEFEPLSR